MATTPAILATSASIAGRVVVEAFVLKRLVPLLEVIELFLLTPGGQMMFDFGDVFAGPVTRARMADDYERSHPGGHFESNYNLLYVLAARYNDS